jgi:hypothetical protein
MVKPTITIMAEKLLTDLFPDATETATSITLTKTSLGLTLATTTADRFLVAVITKSEPVMTETNFQEEPEQNTYISEGFNSFITRNGSQVIVRQKTLNLARIDEAATINPEDY